MSYNPANTAEEMVANQRPSLTVNKGFVRSIPGILKIIILVVDIILWICVGSNHFGAGNGGFVSFVSTISFIFVLFLFIAYVTQLIYRLPGPWILIESLSIVISIILFAICVIISAASYGYGGPAIASAIFCAANAIVYGVEMFLRFRISRGVGWSITARAVDGDVSVMYTTTSRLEDTEAGHTTVHTHTTTTVSGPAGGMASAPDGGQHAGADPYRIP